ncbi:unnamed protein product [Cylindrotheca closterium]|uniref:Uncharacterized protein n=1 Tax=Cylindrotheca closterium TaxID=2856 RepID=A0AAD2CFM9_9STRA|nr:unnamed protein product [Cylindrotheca closterium]
MLRKAYVLDQDVFSASLDIQSSRDLMISKRPDSQATIGIRRIRTATMGSSSSAKILPHENDPSTTEPNSSTDTTEHLPNNQTVVSSTILIPEHPDGQIWRNLNLIWTFRNGTALPNMTETDFNLRRIHPLTGTCPWTAQYRLKLHPGSNETEEYWLLQSLDNHSRPKTMGGDEMYVMYHHRNKTKAAPTAVAYSLDQGDGTYRLDFHTTPFTRRKDINFVNMMGRKGSKLLREGRYQPKGTSETGSRFKIDGGIFTLFMSYTCGLGELHHPAKKEWRTGGAIMRRYHTYVPYPPQMRVFQSPNADRKIDFDKYHKVMIFGDSNLHGLWRDNNQTIKNLHFIRKPDSALQMRSMKRLFLPKIQWFANLTMYEDDNPFENRYALMIGSACWDIVFPENSGPEFNNHLTALRYMLKQLKYTFGPMGNVDIYWHSGLALQLYVAGQEGGWFDRRPLKYMSYHRSFDLYRKQVELLKHVGNITLLDFMHASYLSGHQYIRGDARHVMPLLNRILLTYYYPSRLQQ